MTILEITDKTRFEVGWWGGSQVPGFAVLMGFDVHAISQGGQLGRCVAWLQLETSAMLPTGTVSLVGVKRIMAWAIQVCYLVIWEVTADDSDGKLCAVVQDTVHFNPYLAFRNDKLQTQASTTKRSLLGSSGRAWRKL